MKYKIKHLILAVLLIMGTTAQAKTVTYTNMGVPNINSSFKYIEGTYKGYVYRTYNMVYYVFDVGNGEIRFLTLYNLDYFTDEKINEILSNLVIK